MAINICKLLARKKKHKNFSNLFFTIDENLFKPLRLMFTKYLGHHN